jgi:hypothetical protein
MPDFVIPVLVLVLTLYSATLRAQSDFGVAWQDYETKSEWWVNAGMLSYHVDRSAGYNNANLGLGVEYRFASTASLTAGRFYNSDRDYSNYAGMYWQPLAVGPIKAGAVVGGFNGYPTTNHGGWFAAALPALTIEGRRLGANLFIIPTIGNRVHGALSLQLKWKVWHDP